MLNPLLTSYEKLNFADYLVAVETIILCLTDNANFVGKWPAHLPGLDKIAAKYADVRTAGQAALSRDVNQIALRDKTQDELNLMLRQIRPFLEMTANGDMAILKSTGFPLRTEYSRSTTHAALPAPTGLRITYGPGSGNFDIHVDRLDGAGSYEAAMTTGDPNDESSWKHVATSNLASHIAVLGLTPGQIVWIRVRGVRGATYGVWSDPIRVVVI